METRRYFPAAVMAWSGGVIGAAPATAWLWGDQSTAARAGGDTYVPEPPPVAEELVVFLGILGVLLMAVVGVAIRRYPLTYITLGVMAVVGVLLGATYRVYYADVIGANIGAGLALLFVLPLAGFLTVVGIVLVFVLRPRRAIIPEPGVGARGSQVDDSMGAT